MALKMGCLFSAWKKALGDPIQYFSNFDIERLECETFNHTKYNVYYAIKPSKMKTMGYYEYDGTTRILPMFFSFGRLCKSNFKTERAVLERKEDGSNIISFPIKDSEGRVVDVAFRQRNFPKLTNSILPIERTIKMLNESANLEEKLFSFYEKSPNFAAAFEIVGLHDGAEYSLEKVIGITIFDMEKIGIVEPLKSRELLKKHHFEVPEIDAVIEKKNRTYEVRGTLGNFSSDIKGLYKELNTRYDNLFNMDGILRAEGGVAKSIIEPFEFFKVKSRLYKEFETECRKDKPSTHDAKKAIFDAMEEVNNSENILDEVVFCAARRLKQDGFLTVELGEIGRLTKEIIHSIKK